MRNGFYYELKVSIIKNKTKQGRFRYRTPEDSGHWVVYLLLYSLGLS